MLLSALYDCIYDTPDAAFDIYDIVCRVDATTPAIVTLFRHCYATCCLLMRRYAYVVARRRCCAKDLLFRALLRARCAIL